MPTRLPTLTYLGQAKMLSAKQNGTYGQKPKQSRPDRLSELVRRRCENVLSCAPEASRGRRHKNWLGLAPRPTFLGEGGETVRIG